RRRHDHLRARLRHQLLENACPARGGRPVTSNADRRAALQAGRAAALSGQLEELLTLTGEERALDVGAGGGALAFALGPRVPDVGLVTRPAGTILVVDQLAPADPLAGFELTRFEQARDPSTTRLLADADLRGLFDSNSLVLRRERVVHEPRDLDAYLDLAGCE